MRFLGRRDRAASSPSLLLFFYWSGAVPIKVLLGGYWPAAARRSGRRGGGEGAGPGAGEPAAVGAEAVSAAPEPPLSIAYPLPLASPHGPPRHGPPRALPPQRPPDSRPAPCQRHRRSRGRLGPASRLPAQTSLTRAPLPPPAPAALPLEAPRPARRRCPPCPASPLPHSRPVERRRRARARRLLPAGCRVPLRGRL